MSMKFFFEKGEHLAFLIFKIGGNLKIKKTYY